MFESLVDFWLFLQKNSDAIQAATTQHIFLSYGAVLAGMLFAVPLGIWLTSHDSIAKWILSATSIIQTIPSLAFFGFILPIMGLGFMPAITVLFLFSIFPILRNSYTGLKGVEKSYLEAGQGMGMNARELLFMVRLPLALPVIIAGVRISTVYIISWATLSAFIGGGGLGDLILTGIYTYDVFFILSGAIPAAIMAILTGWVIGFIEKAVTPRGLKV